MHIGSHKLQALEVSAADHCRDGPNLHRKQVVEVVDEAHSRINSSQSINQSDLFPLQTEHGNMSKYGL